MHPNVFLRTFWQMELRPHVFVAMSFSDAYKKRFDNVIQPAINSLKVDGVRLTPKRVDLSNSGDSILTEIMDGIAHSRLVLADVSSVGKDSKSGVAYRNGNVMYEVGIALACRNPADVLLVRDDHDKFMFDVSTIPHMTIDFIDEEVAKQKLIEELKGRLNEQDLVHHAKVTLALNSLSVGEMDLLESFRQMKTTTKVWESRAAIDSSKEMAMNRLINKHLLTVSGINHLGATLYTLSSFGLIIANIVEVRRSSVGTSFGDHSS